MRTRFALIAMLVLTALWTRPLPTQAQLVTVKEDVYVTELRPDKNRIGVASGPSHTTRNWIRLRNSTTVSHRVWHGHNYRDVVISHNQLWRTLRPGMHIRVDGGRDFDQNIVAHRIWLH